MLSLLLIFFSNDILAINIANNNKQEYADSIAKFYGLPSSKNLIMLGVKGYQQTTDFTCGPASVMSLMSYYGMLKEDELNNKTELRIAKEMGGANPNGVDPQKMVLWLKKNGFEVRSGENGTLEMLRDNLKNGTPVIVEWIDWGGHWVVVTGYDIEDKVYQGGKDSLFFADPAVHFNNVKYINGLSVFNPYRFESMWFDARLFNPGHLVRGIYIIAIPNKKLK